LTDILAGNAQKTIKNGRLLPGGHFDIQAQNAGAFPGVLA